MSEQACFGLTDGWTIDTCVCWNVTISEPHALDIPEAALAAEEAKIRP